MSLFESTDRPLEVTLVVLPDTSLMSLAATLDPLRGANRLSGRPCYRWRVVSPDGRDPRTSCGLTIKVDGALDPAAHCDLLIVLAAFNVHRHADAAFRHKLLTAARNAGHVGGIEAGPWVLALCGLLDGRAATTHWEDLEDFAAAFPDVRTVSDRWVVDGRFFTTGAAAPALDFLLNLVRARQGQALSLEVAGLYVYDGMRAGSQGQSPVALGRIAARDPQLAAAVRMMESTIDEPLGVAEIARRAGISRRALETAFARLTGKAPGAFYLELRLNAARRLIVDTDISVAEVAVRTGFSSVSALSRSFRRHFGQPPQQARRDSSETSGISVRPAPAS
ncbi:GlxA family transcriptional regulator [Jiella sonneratiae]|uniref:GlxA family transcriptional regulator n=1 Tax=Jiella sonneratiae TaxID=2816856 RepID=A0ABS3J9F9_9HYPH|nr:GlxA family transcriptional regulator [Jiella sonneratiae]MBO0906309.1 GlxA family transcriptional regulator [Jiella sonneratiae]